MMRRRVTLAVIGLLLIGGTSASVAAMTTNHPGTSSPGTAQINPTAPDGTATSTSGTQDGTPTPLISPSPTLPPSGQPSPTATQPSAPPTATPRTPPPSGQNLDLHGKITNKTANTFTYRDTTGALWTVSVNQSTQYQGAATNFSQLQVDMLAEVKGQTTGGFNLLATLVNSQADN